jgi:hypothetical protein
MKDESLPLPPGHHGQTQDEIAAEIADHLAAAEADLTKHGIAADEARQAARKKFGDVEKIQKTCYWIQNGETIMLRWTLVALASVLCVLLGLSVLGNWRTQSQLAEQVGKLSEELKAMAAAKQIPPPVPQPPEITGVIYAGTKDKPMANAAIAVIKTDGTVVRRTGCDAQGRYRSGPLEAGDYCIATETENPPLVVNPISPNARWFTQTQPLFVHASSGTVPLDIDARFHQGELKISTSRTLPEIHRPKKYYLTSRLHVFVNTPRQRDEFWTTAALDSPKTWPVYALAPQLAGRGGHARAATALFNLKEGEEVPYVGRGDAEATIFPAGTVPIAATLFVNIFPMDQEEKALAQDPALSPRFLVDICDSKLAIDSGWAWWDFPPGKQWLEKLDGKPINAERLTRFRSKESQPVELKEDVFTRIRAEIPEGIEQEIERAMETTTNVDEFKKLIDNGLLTRRLKLTVVGFEPYGEAKIKL